MNKIDQLRLKENEKSALLELKERITRKFPDAEVILYGSKARGNADEFSDIDILITLNLPVDTRIKESITEITYPLELKYDVVFGKIVQNKRFWTSPLIKATPFHHNVDREGIQI